MVPYRRLYKQMEAVTVLGSLDYTRSRAQHLRHDTSGPQKVRRGGMPAALEKLCDAPNVVQRIITIRRPHQNVDKTHERRVQRVAALVQVVVGKDRTIVLCDGANDRVLGQIRLDDNLAGTIAATGAAGDLFQQIVGALPRPKIGQL